MPKLVKLIKKKHVWKVKFSQKRASEEIEADPSTSK